MFQISRGGPGVPAFYVCARATETKLRTVFGVRHTVLSPFPLPKYRNSRLTARTSGGLARAAADAGAVHD